MAFNQPVSGSVDAPGESEMGGKFVLRQLFHRAARILLIGCSLLTVIHIILYLLSNYAIKKIEIRKIEDFSAEIPGKLLVINDDRIHYIEKGKGKPIIFLHGFAGSTDNWEQTIYRDLPENRRTICIDLFGMGFSERREAWHYDFPFWAEQVYDVMQVMKISRASIVGFSLGGSVAAMFAAKYPEKVERLVLISSLAPFNLSDLPIRSMIYYIPGGGEIMLTIPAVFLAYGSPESNAFKRYRQISSIIGTRHALLTFMKEVPDFQGLTSSYPRIKARTLLIHGTKDRVVPLSAVKRVVPHIPSCRSIYLDNVGHWVLGEARERLVLELTGFLYD